jgi:hypothetical protein
LLTHEELVLDPFATSRFLSERLDLSDLEQVPLASPEPPRSCDGGSATDPLQSRDIDAWSPNANWRGESTPPNPPRRRRCSTASEYRFTI